ncbi:hypothetical protein BRADI_1g07126v3, partial [Brachypodium distachyon]
LHAHHEFTVATKRACSDACPSTKRLRECDEASSSSLLLPVDLLLEIAARADVATVVRCAATSKHFRAAILEQGFRRRRRLLNGRAAAGFDPSSVRGISYKLTDRDEDDICRSHTVRLLQTPPSDTAISRSRAVSLCLEPVAWRDGLVILRHSQSGELAACNRNTGHEAPLGDPAALAVSDDYPHALLTVDGGGGGGGGGSFELLVADKDLRFQTYSSRHGKWGAVVHAAAAAAQHHLHHPPSSQTARTRDPSKHPVVINGNSVHWLCGCRGGLDAGRLHIVALGVDTAAAGARATVIDLPRGCVSRMMGFKHKSGITLAVSADGRLSLVVSETQVISMWTSEVGDPDQITWSRRVVVDRQEWGVHASIRFEGFGERSGTLLFYMSYVGLVQLNLVTNKALVVLHRKHPCASRISQFQADADTAALRILCAHEVLNRINIRSFSLRNMMEGHNTASNIRSQHCTAFYLKLVIVMFE